MGRLIASDMKVRMSTIGVYKTSTSDLLSLLVVFDIHSPRAFQYLSYFIA